MGGGPGSHTDLSQFSGACIGETERPASSIQCPTLPCILAYGVMTSVASPSPESEFLPVHPVRPDGLQLSQVHYTARADAPAILHLATNASNELTKKVALTYQLIITSKITRLCDLPFVLQSPSTESTQPQTTVCCEFATKGSSSRLEHRLTWRKSIVAPTGFLRTTP